MGARNLRLSAVLAVSLASAGLCPEPAAATIADAGSAPPKLAVAATGSASVTIDWTVERLTADPPQPGTVSSSTLRILIGGVQAAGLSRPLSRSLPGTAPNETVRFREAVPISRALIHRAVREGSALIIRRRFVDSTDDSFMDAELEVTPSGPASAALSVQRLDLTFDDGSRTRVLPKGAELRAVAEIRTAGFGLLAGVWETAFGAAAKAPPVFRPLAVVRQGVSSSGRTVITSPRLPTDQAGSGFVRFRVTEPGLRFTKPALQYYVTAQPTPGEPAAVADILLTGPQPGTPLNAETRFSWQAVASAEAYQLVFFAAEAGPAAGGGRLAGDSAPLAGVLLHSGETEAVVDDVTLDRLPAGRSYLWQVIAFDANGAVIGSSSLREIYRP